MIKMIDESSDALGGIESFSFCDFAGLGNEDRLGELPGLLAGHWNRLFREFCDNCE